MCLWIIYVCVGKWAHVCHEIVYKDIDADTCKVPWQKIKYVILDDSQIIKH